VLAIESRDPWDLYDHFEGTVMGSSWPTTSRGGPRLGRIGP
jgi:hypothetical protein